MPKLPAPDSTKPAKPAVKPATRHVTDTHHSIQKALKPSLSAKERALGAENPQVVPVPPGGGKPAPKPKPKPQISDLQRFLWAEGEQESGNNWLAENPTSGALGRWQVMPENLPKWLPESGYPVLSPNQFLHNDKAQTAVANTILGGYFKEYGAAGAAAMWYSGDPDPNATDGDPPVYEYVADVLKLMNSSEVAPVAVSGTSVVMPWNLPKVQKSDSWASQVSNSATVLASAGKVSLNYATAIRHTYAK